MKRILVPIDFSAVSKNAYKYACHLAESMYAEIHLLHVHHVEVMAQDPVFLAVREDPDEIEARMRHFVTEYPHEEDCKLVEPTSIRCQVGDPATQIAEAAKTGVDIIVMGTREQHGVLDKWLGTVSSSVGRQARCPVLLVPGNVSYRKPENIVFASDILAGEKRIIDQLASFNKPYGATIHFVHVQTDGDEDFAPTKEKLFSTLFAAGEPDFPFEMITLHDYNVVERVFQYAKNHDAALIVVASEKRGLLASFTHKSVSKQFVLHGELPVMVIHA